MSFPIWTNILFWGTLFVYAWLKHKEEEDIAKWNVYVTCVACTQRKRVHAGCPSHPEENLCDSCCPEEDDADQA